MVSSISSTANDSIQLMMAQMFQKMNAADTDGTAGLSKAELSSIDSGNDFVGSAFLKSLSSQFDSIDADGNGQLSASEIASAKPPSGPMGPPPGLNLDSMDSTSSTGSTASANATAKSIENWLEKMLKELVDSFEKKVDSTASKDQTTNENSSNASIASAINSLSSADTDGISGLSQGELLSITSDDAGKANFINNLLKNFSSIDTDGNGQLSQSEIETSRPKNQQSTLASSAGTLGHTLGSLSGSFIQKLLSNYDGSNLSNLTSSLSVAG